MAFTFTSSKATVSIATLTGTYKCENAGKGYMLYVSYTKGTESGITLTITARNQLISATNYYSICCVSEDYYVSPIVYKINASGYYRIPIYSMLQEDQLQVVLAAISGTASGTVNIEITPGE